MQTLQNGTQCNRRGFFFPGQSGLRKKNNHIPRREKKKQTIWTENKRICIYVERVSVHLFLYAGWGAAAKGKMRVWSVVLQMGHY